MEKTYIPVLRKIPAVYILLAVMASWPLFPTQSYAQPVSSETTLAINSQRSENIINVRLNGATEYELVDVFGRVLNNSHSVIEARRHGSRIVPDNPRACFTVWRLRVKDSDPNRLQADIIKVIRDIRNTGGQVVVRGVVHRYTRIEVDLLKGVRPGSISGGEVQFVVH